MVTVGERVVGTWVESPKPDCRLKIANMFIVEEHRGEGLGRVMVDQAVRRWIRTPYRHFYVTVSEESLAAVGGLLVPYGFVRESVVEGRYREGMAETVLSVGREDLVLDPPLAHQSLIMS